MNEINPLLEKYNSLVNVIMNTDYTVKEYIATEQKIVTTLKAMRGKLGHEHLHNITRISKVLNSEAVMVPMAETVGSIQSRDSFDYLLDQFLECYEYAQDNHATAKACYEAMVRLDPERVIREGIDQHPALL
jgi:hypothetical protein